MPRPTATITRPAPDRQFASPPETLRGESRGSVSAAAAARPRPARRRILPDRHERLRSESSPSTGLAGKQYVRRKLALKHLPGEEQLSVLVFIPRAIGDQCAVEPQRQSRCEVADLICMRKEHQLWLLFRDEMLQRVDVGVGGVVFERGRLQRVDMGAALMASSTAGALRLFPGRTTSTAHPVSLAMDWAAAMVSNETRLSLPSRCSATTRMVSGMGLSCAY